MEIFQKEVKTALAAEAARAKKEKAKLRKQAKIEKGHSTEVASRTDADKAPRKRVSFAG